MTDQAYDIIDLATQELDAAISLFLARQSFAFVRTLARAAEEILSKALLHRGEQDFVERKREALEPLHTFLHRRSLSRAEFIREENHAFIAVTRTESASEPSDTFDLEEAALWIIVRACHNYDLLGLPLTSNMRKFKDWYYEQVVGLADPLSEYVI